MAQGRPLSLAAQQWGNSCLFTTDADHEEGLICINGVYLEEVIPLFCKDEGKSVSSPPGAGIMTPAAFTRGDPRLPLSMALRQEHSSL